MPDLIKGGYVYIAQPPLYRLKKGNSTVYKKDDNDLEKIDYKITPYKTPSADYDALRIEADTKNVQRIKNNFNLKSFPFDRQTLKYTFVNNNYSMQDQLLFSNQFTYETLDNFRFDPRNPLSISSSNFSDD